MVLVRPRLTDHFGIHAAQESLDFAIPFLDEDIPLYVDPFLLWKSPAQQDQALHTLLTNSFNHLGALCRKGKTGEAAEILMQASEAAEVGLGTSKNRAGKRIGERKAHEILSLFETIGAYRDAGFVHFEECQLFVEGIAKDRVSDISCSFVKSFLVDYTHQCCSALGIPLSDVEIECYDYKGNAFKRQRASLPVRPDNGQPVLVVPRRWLRHLPWLNFDDYFKKHCPLHDDNSPGEVPVPTVLRYNRENYGAVKAYVEAKERAQQDCHSDPLFQPIPISSAKNTLAEILKLPTGKTDGADKEFEDRIARLYSSTLYPHLDFAATQSRTIDGVHIRDLVFYNNASIDFLKEILGTYSSSQLVFEMKNVAEVETEHVNQLNRYLSGPFGGFGVIITRKRPSKAVLKNTVDLWSAQRKCILIFSDEDTELLVQLFDSKQRDPLDVMKRKYVEFQRLCPK